MRTIDFAPLFRSTVGFDRLFDMIDNGTRESWPPHNIEKLGDDRYRIEMAVAGFTEEDIEIVQQGNVLLVSGRKKTEPKAREVLHQGLAFRNFRQTFNLADHVKVVSAKLENGLMSIELVREIPEQLKPRRIAIASAANQNGRAQVASEPAGERQAA